MPTIADQITNNANMTSQMQATKPRVTGTASSEMGSDQFLMLMMKQLQCQDPLNPMDNKDFIAQQAQFTQVSATKEMSELTKQMNQNMSTNNSIMQTLSLVGKKVSLTDPADKEGKKTIEGVVSEAKFTNTGAAIMVNGKEYPISLVKSVKPV